MRYSIIIGCILLSTVARAQGDKESFYTYCGPCHTIGNGKLVGPDLKDVQKKFTNEQMINWVKSVQANQRIIADSLLILTKLHPERKMDNFSYMKDQDIQAIVNYIKTVSEFNWIGPIPDRPVAKTIPYYGTLPVDTSSVLPKKPNGESTHMHNLEFFWYFQKLLEGF